jgi:hypothetical protein
MRSRHYTRDEIDALCEDSPVDILLVHDAPAGIRFEKYRHGSDWVSETVGLDRLIYHLRPLVCFFGHLSGVNYFFRTRLAVFSDWSPQ